MPDRLLLRVMSILIWTVGSLIVLDATIGVVFRAPADPAHATNLERYFDYGRSIEGKLRRLVGSSPNQDAPIVKAGWLDGCDVPTLPQPGKIAFDVYGMSFSDRVADALETLDPRFSGNRFGGPAAPPNHSYACFVRRVDLGLERAPIQVLGVLASAIPRMDTLGGLTTSFEEPMPFTYPRYSLTAERRLVERSSSIRSEADLHATLSDATKWQTFLSELSTGDVFYSRELFKADVFDHSVLARMIRRAWAQRSFRVRLARLRPDDNFSGSPDIAPVLVNILLDFAAKSRAMKQLPIVILFEDRGFGTDLSAIVAPALRAHQIAFIATSTIAAPTDASNFLSDGHFTPTVDRKIAQAVLKLLEPIREV
jgi:hypothetical protein